MPIRLVLLCVLGLAVTACTITPYRVPLSESARVGVGQPAVYTQLADTGVGIELFEQDSKAGAQAAAGLVGLLLAAAADSAANAKPAAEAEAAAERIRPTVDLARLRERFETGVRDRLQGVGPFQQPILARTLQQYHQMDIASFSEQQTVMALNVSYSLTSDLRHVRVIADAFLLSRAPVVEGAKSGIAYRNRLEYVSDALAPGTAPAAGAAFVDAWTSGDAAKLNAELAAGTDAVLAMLARDLADPATVELPTSLPLETELEVQGERALVRVNRGLYPGALVSEPAGYTATAFNRVVYPPTPVAAPATK